MTIPKISQAANAAAERYFAMRRNAPDHADRSLAEIIEGVIAEEIKVTLSRERVLIWNMAIDAAMKELEK